MSERDLSDLIARVEAATGPDREIDVAILRALPIEGGWFSVWPDHLTWDSLDAGKFAPPLTASLDAALGLAERVLPGVMWQVGFDPDDGSMCARLVTVPPPCAHVKANHDTPALALCLAILKAVTHDR